MPPRQQITALLFEAVDQLNGRLPSGRRLEKGEATPIAGDRATLESLEYITLVLEFEGLLRGRLGSGVAVAERLVADAGPPESLGALVDLAVTACEQQPPPS